jgi:PAS domain S-box-containing protein
MITAPDAHNDLPREAVSPVGKRRGRSPGLRLLKEMQAHEYLFNSFLNDILDPLYFKDTEGRFVRANQAMAALLNVANPEALVGKSDFDFLPPERAQAIVDEEQEILSATKPVLGRVERQSWPGRSEMWVTTNKLVVRDSHGKIIGVIGIFRDITGQKLAEQQAGERAALLDKARDAILLVGVDNRILYWNQGAQRIYGWSSAEVLGRKVEDVLAQGVVSPQLHEALQTIRTKGEWSGELEEISKTGMKLIVQSRCNLVNDIANQSGSIFVINTDITEHKQLEAQLLRSQRLESLGRLASGIAHDLNNVLTPLLIAVQLLKDKLPDPTTRKLLDSLDTNVQRGAKLLKQVLVFGRGVAGQPRPLDLGRIIQEVSLMVQETFPKSIVFESHVPADLWAVNADATQLYQVLLNLCVNARDAMPNGGYLSIFLTNVTLSQLYVRLPEGVKPGPYILIKVMDTGTGIPLEIQNRIFDPFFSTKAPDKGTGLGLSTCYGIVRSHGGFINVSSKVGAGSVFKVYVPANPAAITSERPETDTSPVPEGAQELVLVIDDEEAIRSTTRTILEAHGYRVVTAANGAEGVALYGEPPSEIAAVITDMAMPVMDGPTAIATLRSMNPEVVIIATSGLGTNGTRATALKAGALYFIPKPFAITTLLQTLHEALHRAAAPVGA